MKDAEKILFKAFDVKIVSRSPVRTDLTKEEFDYAVSKGVMFADTEDISHEECLKRIRSALGKISPEDVAEGFLYSLSSRALQYRSAMGSYWYARSIPEHKLDGGRTSCNICKYRRLSNKKLSAFGKAREYDTYPNEYNYSRYKYGGTSHTKANFAMFDLEEFLKLPKAEHTAADEKILRDILALTDKLEPRQKAGGLQKAITSAKIIRSNKSELDTLLDILGICGILEDPEHRCYDEGFMDCINRDPPELTNDYAYPLNWWRAEHGVNRERFEIVFKNVMKY